MIARISYRSALKSPACVHSKSSTLRWRKPNSLSARFGTTQPRLLATVASTIILGPPPDSSDASGDELDPIEKFHQHLLTTLIVNTNNASNARNSGGQSQRCLKELVKDCFANSERVLEKNLKGESRPRLGRRLVFEGDDLSVGKEGSPPDLGCGDDLAGKSNEEGIVIVAHCFKTEGNMGTFMIMSCLGFVIDVDDGLVVTSAHPLKQIAQLVADSDESNLSSGSFIITPRSEKDSDGIDFDVHTVTAVPACLPRSGILLLAPSPSARPLKSLPISPHPLPPGSPVRLRFFNDDTDGTVDEKEWTPWIGGTRRSWVKGVVEGYRDLAGREAVPGTHNALDRLIFTPLPPPSSAGGPIVDEKSGAVVGIILGVRTDSFTVDGPRRFGVPGEMVFEMFSLPGLEGKK